MQFSEVCLKLVKEHFVIFYLLRLLQAGRSYPVNKSYAFAIF